MKLLWVPLLMALLTVAAPSGVQSPAVVAQTKIVPESPLLKLRGLVTLCERGDPTSRAACGGYITGFVQGSQVTQMAAVVRAISDGIMNGTVAPTDDSIEIASKKLRDKSRLFCIQSNWTASYVSAVIVQYGLEHGDLLDEMPGDHMLKILVKAFPCGASK